MSEDDWVQINPEFEAGIVDCPCGSQVQLWFNGGELDQETCRQCGREFRTVHVQIALEMRELNRQLGGDQ